MGILILSALLNTLKIPVNGYADHLHPETWKCVQQVKSQIAWDRHKNKTANYIFADGHAENLHLKQTWTRPGKCYWYPSAAPSWPDHLKKK